MNGYAQQNLKVTYKEKRVMTDFYKKNLDNYPAPIKNKLIQEFQGVFKELIIDGNTSLYRAQEKDAEYSQKFPDQVDDNVTTKKTSKTTIGGTSIYKNATSNLLLIEKSVRDEKLLIKDKLNATQWELTNETKQINDLTCKKAIAKDDKGRKIVAWYAEEIPINNGPAEFGGLPGLIVYVETASWIYEMQKLEKLSNPETIVIPSSEDAMTMAEFKSKFTSKNGIKKSTVKTSRRKVQ
jgi:GLPGLI family protein